MKTRLVVTWTCPDRPGIVERVTEVVAGCSANWEESRMVRLGGDFAGIAMISVSEGKAEALAESLRALADDQMTVVVKTARPASDSSRECALYQLRLTGADHEGIVRRVSGYLAEQGVNVESMETDVASAPITGSPLFQMEARIMTPPELSPTELKMNLERIAEELGVDIDVSSVAR